MRGNERYFLRGGLPWVRMPWPLYLYSACPVRRRFGVGHLDSPLMTMPVTPCAQCAMHTFTERERERARRLALEGPAKELSSAAPDRNVASVDVRGKQGRRSSGEPDSDTGRGQEDT